MRIIARLNEDGRTPFSEIADTLGVSESQVRQRLKRLVSSGAVRVMALTSPRGMGFSVALLAIRLAAGRGVREAAATLAALPAVIYVAIPAGAYDIFAEVVCTGLPDLLEVIEREIRPLPDIAHVEPWMYLQLHYRPVIPAEATAGVASRL